MTEILTLSHVIAGRAVEGGADFEQRNPADPDDLVVRVPRADAGLAEEAASAARAALPRVDAAGIEARSDALDRLARALTASTDELGLLIARETGKTIKDAKAEVGRAARIASFFSGEVLRNVGERFDSTRPGATVEVTYEAAGVVAAVTPWNFPVAIPVWKIAPALAFGCSVVWKPSEVSSASAAALMRLIEQAGFVEGSVNLLLGDGPAGAAVVGADTDAVSFTGSESTGAKVRLAAAQRGARVQLEMGGVNGAVVLADADLDVAVEAVLNAAFFATGQRCTATSRVIVEDQVADAFVAKLAERTRGLKIGDPRDTATDLGPLASPAQKARVMAALKDVEAAGLKPVFGGVLEELPHAFVAPTLYDRVEIGAMVVREEIFGPVAGVVRVANYDEALHALNATRFGLSAGIFTRSLKHAEHFKRHARAGMVMVNLPTAGVDYHAPFGGVAASSYGPREQGRAARAFYTTPKTAYQRPL